MDMDDILNRYARVLGILDRSRVRTIIQYLNVEKVPNSFFTDSLQFLYVLQFDRESGAVKPIGCRVNPLIETIIEVAKGTYGKIYRSDNGEYIYKEFEINNDAYLEYCVRQVFLEAFIQTVLGADSKYGKNISTTVSLYRSENSLCIPKTFSLFLKMECLPHTLIDTINMNQLHTIDSVRPVFIQFCEILSYFQDTYGFRHGDLHVFNVMFAHDYTLKLIDFGMSQITMKGVEYSLRSDKVRVYSKSCDMLVFLSSFLYVYSKFLTPELDWFLQSLFVTNNGTNLYAYWFDNSALNYHIMYDWAIEEKWPLELKNELEISANRFTPRYIANILKKN